MKKLFITATMAIALPLTVFAREYETYADCTQDNGTKFCDGYFAGKKKADKVEPSAKTEEVSEQTSAPEKKEEPKSKPFGNVFIGLNIGLGAVSYENENVADYMPSAFFKGGLDLGFKLNLSQEFSLGTSVSIDELFPSELNPSYVRALGMDSMTIAYSIAGATLDMYVDAGSGEYVVLGVGGGSVSASMTGEVDGVTVNMDNYQAGMEDLSAFIFKFGLEYDVSQAFAWNIMFKVVSPEDSGIGTMMMFDFGAKLKF